MSSTNRAIMLLSSHHCSKVDVFIINSIQENGFEFDLAPFACRRVEISFAVATQQMNVSSYSAATTVELSTGSGKYEL